jgi:hypothetical protein
MHEVPPTLKSLVIDALAQMGTGHYKQSRIKNTRYISVKLIGDIGEDGTFRPSSVVVRIYDKDLEVYNRYYTEDVAKDFRRHQYAEYTPPNYVRVELALRREAIVNKLGDKSQATTRQTDPNTTLGALLMNPKKQAEILDNHFQRMGFYECVYSSRTFCNEIDAITKIRKTKANIKTTARLLRNGKNPNISPDALRGVRELLKDNGISLVTTGRRGYDLPPIDRAALLAQSSVFVEAESVPSVPLL